MSSGKHRQSSALDHRFDTTDITVASRDKKRPVVALTAAIPPRVVHIPPRVREQPRPRPKTRRDLIATQRGMPPLRLPKS